MSSLHLFSLFLSPYNVFSLKHLGLSCTEDTSLPLNTLVCISWKRNSLRLQFNYLIRKLTLIQTLFKCCQLSQWCPLEQDKKKKEQTQCPGSCPSWTVLSVNLPASRHVHPDWTSHLPLWAPPSITHEDKGQGSHWQFSPGALHMEGHQSLGSQVTNLQLPPCKTQFIQLKREADFTWWLLGVRALHVLHSSSHPSPTNSTIIPICRWRNWVCRGWEICWRFNSELEIKREENTLLSFTIWPISSRLK